MKKPTIYIFAFFLSVYGLWYFLYPETLACVEANSFFVVTPDYLNAKITQPGGTGILLNDFLSQFYRWREIGALIQSLFVTLVLVLSRYLLIRLKGQAGFWMAMLPACAFLLLQQKWYVVSFSFQFVLFCGLLTFYSIIEPPKVRRAISLVMLPFFSALLPPGIVILLFVYFFFLEYFLYNQRNAALIWPFSGLVLSFFMPLLWSSLFSFVSSVDRYCFVTQLGTPVYPAYMLYAGIIPFFVFACRSLIKSKVITITLFFLESCVTLLVFCFNTYAWEREQFAAVEHYALASDWDGVLDRISEEDAKNDPRLQRYALLALQEKNLLVDHLFSFHLSSPDCFYFYLSKNPFCQRFNSLFYASLGIYNEAIRQTFEASLQTDNGITFQDLRQMTDWFLKEGNAPVAEKYMTLLRYSTFHGRWIRKREVLLATLRQKTIAFPLERNQIIFTSAYPFTQEMSCFLEYDPENLKKEEYFLLALLIKKDLDRFLMAITSLPYFLQKSEIPASFQQALTIIASDKPDLLMKINISRNIMDSYKKIRGQLSKNQILSGEYNNTYWSYYWQSSIGE